MTTRAVPAISTAARAVSGSERIRALGSADEDLILLDKGEPSFPTPGPVVAAAVEAMRQGYTRYPPAGGDPELRRNIAIDLRRRNGPALGEDEIYITSGASAAIYASMAAYLNQGDEVLVHDPAYSLYAEVAALIGAIPVRVAWSEDFRLDFTALESAVSPRAKVLVINSPCNPTGVVLEANELHELAKFAERHRLVIISDEAYSGIVYDGDARPSIATFTEAAERTITINTCSKAFAMTGWRVGYLAGPRSLIAGPSIVHRTAVGHVNHIAQRAAIVAFAGLAKWEAGNLREYRRRRDAAVRLVGKVRGLSCTEPQGAFYLFVRVESGHTSEQFVRLCRDEAGVAIRSGSEFGPAGEGYVRLSFAGDPDEFANGVGRIAAALRATQPSGSAAGSGAH